MTALSLRQSRIQSTQRRGWAATELIVAATLLLTAIAIAGKLTVEAGRLWMDVRHHQLAMDELSNQLERLVALGASERQAALAELSPSESVREMLAGARLVGQSLDDQDGQRLVLNITWDRRAKFSADSPSGMGFRICGIHCFHGGETMIRRPAYTLIELLLTMSFGSTLMLSAVGLVHQAMRLSATTRDLANNDRNATRLARQFRHDVHRADQVVVNSEESMLVKLSDVTVALYTVNANRVVREQSTAGSSEHRESFSFGSNISVKFLSLASPLRAEIMIERSSGLSGVESRVDRRLIADVGRLRRLETMGDVKL